MADPSPISRDELVAMVTRAHQDASYVEATEAGRALAAQSKLPGKIAENLGAGFGQWDFFPEPKDIVEFACAYVPPSTVEDVWTMARAWAADDAAGRHTMIALVGRDILQLELRRIEVPELQPLFDETRPARVLAMRAKLGLAVPSVSAPGEPPSRAAALGAALGTAEEPARPTAPDAPKRKAAKAPKVERPIPTHMPKPAFVRPVKAPPPPPPKRFVHPKLGEGVLEKQDGEGPQAKLTIKFDSGTKTVLASYVTELPT